MGPMERRGFAALNADAGRVERPIWIVMQLGNGLIAIVAPALLRLTGRTWAESARVGVAAHGAWQLAKLVKAFVGRGRPGSLVDGVVLRDGDPVGRGFVSGHATVAASVALVASPLVPRSVRPLLALASGGVAFARVHVGAHLPLDVVGGLALAVVWSHSLDAVVAAATTGAFR